MQLPAEHVWLLEHEVHAAPPTPHAALDVPDRHTSPEQHPFGHVVELHVATHCVPLHTCALEHVPHVAPPVPHAVAVVPERQTPFWQQPFGHVDALHANAHCCALQVWLLPHAEHAWPPVPHALVEVPAWHTLPMQQPEGQVVELHVDAVTQLRPSQVWLPEQLEHCAPPVPHAEVEVPLKHTSPAQQPEGQVVALQVEPPTQLPPVHAWPPLHVEHCAPPRPHAEVEVPDMQMPS